MITQQQYEEALKAKKEAENTILQHELQQKKCCVCGEIPVTYTWSIMGQIKFYLCAEHSGGGSYMGCGGMGVSDKRGNPLEIKFHKEGISL